MYKSVKTYLPYNHLNLQFFKDLPLDLYINDLLFTTNFHIKLYADDTALFMFDKNLYPFNKRVNDELVNIDN